MSAAKSLLIELGTEELPPKALDELSAAFARGICEGLVKCGIEAAVDERAGCLHLVFSDQGIAYDPLSHNAKKVDPADEQRKGGLGILLMRKYMDDLRYTRADGRNILRMTKRFV